MTPKDATIWAAVYAAAYVAWMERCLDAGVSFDKVLANGNAERAETIADAAVRELRLWRKEGRAR